MSLGICWRLVLSGREKGASERSVGHGRSIELQHLTFADGYITERGNIGARLGMKDSGSWHGEE
jgi:hypothetical protein